MKDKIRLLKRGLAQPTKVPPYVLGKLFPRSRWSGVDYRDEFITCRVRRGSFVQGATTKPEYCARLYLDVRSIRRLVEAVAGEDVDTLLEVGCGYGRLTPWFTELAAEVHGVEPNETVLERAQRLYPDVEFRNELAQELSYPDGTFEVIVTCNALEYIPPGSIDVAAGELRRVLAPGGAIVVGEQTGTLDREDAWGRSKSEYERLFEPLDLVESRPKPVEPTFTETNVVREDGRVYHAHEHLLAFADGANVD